MQDGIELAGAFEAAGVSASVIGAGAVSVHGVSYDSRQVEPGELFVAMRGETTDGNRYVDMALARGAVAVITDSPEVYGRLSGTVPVGLVQHGRRALARASAAILGHPEWQLAVIGVTGTNGKTTTAFLVEALLKSAGRRCVLLGTIETHVGEEVRPSAHTTPEASDVLAVFADGVEAGATEAVMEMSSHALDQERVWGLPVDVAVFTNLTQDHLDYHGTMEAYFAAKRRLFEGVGTAAPRVAVVNLEDAYGRRLAAEAASSQVVTYGLGEGADFRAAGIGMRAGETRFQMTTPVGEVAMESPLAGRVNVLNLLAASAAAWARGLTLAEIAKGAAAIAQVPGRFQVVLGGGGFAVVVDYAHTEDALRNLIALGRELVLPASGRVLTVFGCGGDRDRGKRPKMGRAAGEGSDLVVLTSDNPRSEDPQQILAEVLNGVIETGVEHVVEQDRKKAIAVAVRSAKLGDIVLIAGKGHEKVQILKDGTVPFDDVSVAAELLREIEVER